MCRGRERVISDVIILGYMLAFPQGPRFLAQGTHGMSGGQTLRLEDDDKEQCPKLPCCSGPMDHGHWTRDPPFSATLPAPMATSRVDSASLLPPCFLAPTQVGSRCLRFWLSLGPIRCQLQGSLGK